MKQLSGARSDLADGMVQRHENTGFVEEVVPGMDRIRAGDRAPVPFSLACGTASQFVYV